ncbi:unnamed protein product, partial [Ilex paraguariensis]
MVGLIGRSSYDDGCVGGGVRGDSANGERNGEGRFGGIGHFWERLDQMTRVLNTNTPCSSAP